MSKLSDELRKRGAEVAAERQAKARGPLLPDLREGAELTPGTKEFIPPLTPESATSGSYKLSDPPQVGGLFKHPPTVGDVICNPLDGSTSSAVKKPPAGGLAVTKAKKTETPAEKVKLACNHEVTLKSLTCQKCGPCQHEGRIAKQKRRAEKLGSKRDALVVAGLSKGRLPHGAVVRMSWDAEKVMWTGTLGVDGKIFEASASGQFKCFTALDDAYRDSLRGAS